MANRRNGTLYTGVTSDLLRRVHQHREGAVAGFSSRYGCKILVWYETLPSMMRRSRERSRSRAGRGRRRSR
ncbi:GIY-YIG nuclease family protein [Inquilinus limosus]|uniref:GIY-YIG nuclease family protein n=1 Tax=Inquilinus limosus TaxID=171674 RepID=UPI003F5CD9DD